MHLDACNIVDWAYLAIYLMIALGVLVLAITSPVIHARYKDALRRDIMRHLEQTQRGCARCAADAADHGANR